ncbi:hypothetical protein AB1Y20_000670 [Prymnesium parvum]|uniref:Uncharacterized protein n=1 Tax=Prymnesium parvum TaxID=97485 RepID=A0AB34KB30_PRYPA
MTAPWDEAAAAQALADERRRQAAALAEKARQLLVEAEEAQRAADDAQLQADAQKRMANVGEELGELSVLGEKAATALCGKLSRSFSELKETAAIRAEQLRLGEEDARGFAYLITARSLPNLEFLSLARNALGDAGTAVLAQSLRPDVPLRHLDLASNSIRETGAAEIGRAMKRGALPLLRKLSLKNNDIDDHGAVALFSTSHDNVEWLNLSHNQIANSGGLSVSRALADRHFKCLRRLSLDHNQLGDKAMDALTSALSRGTELTELYVDFNPASDDAIQAVQLFFEDEAEPVYSRSQHGQSTCSWVSNSLKDTCVCQ